MNDKILMPTSLTAENGGKSVMSGEFFEEVEMQCPECADDCETDDCYHCDGNSVYMQKVPISWTNIKAIYSRAVEHFGEEVK